MAASKNKTSCPNLDTQPGRNPRLFLLVAVFVAVFSPPLIRAKIRKNLVAIETTRFFIGAAGQIRTADLILTKYLLAAFTCCRLSCLVP